MVQPILFRGQKKIILLISLIILCVQYSSAQTQKMAKTPAKAPPGNTQSTNAQPPSSMENLFEGYYKILVGEKHIGYLIARYDYNTKQKQFVAKTFQKIKTDTEEEMQSLVAISDDGFNPIKYEFTSSLKQGQTTKTRTIDAQFKNNKMTALFQEDGIKKTITKDIPKGVFLSTFLTYLILKQPKGMTANLSINYSAIAEEDADIYSGKVSTGKLQKMKGFSVLEAKTDYKQNKFTAYITDRGEVMGTVSPLSGVGSELVAQPSEATQGMELNSKILQSIFGEIPLGINNMVAKAARSNSILPTQESGKTFGVPPGIGIQIKNPPEKTLPEKNEILPPTK
ncbi:MAG: hypothetical protein ACK5P5_12110 [Pseudobdellovibrionaceae bacterium]